MNTLTEADAGATRHATQVARGATGRIAAASARRPWLTLTMWLLALVGLGAAATGLQLVDGDGGSAIESDVADGLYALHAEDNTAPTEIIVVSSDSLTFADAVFAARVDALAAAASDVDGVAGVESPATVSADGDTVLISVTLAEGDEDALLLTAENLLIAVNEVTAAGSAGVAGDTSDGVRAALLGDASGENVFGQLTEDTLLKGELIGIGVAFIILAFVFGAVVAATMPLVIAITSIVTAVGLTALFSHVMDLHLFTINMVTMMGLALGIDYALVAVQRFREERAAGRSIEDAVAIMGTTANRAILISGSTVVVSLVSMLLVPSVVMRSLGLGAILVAVTSVFAALTLLPAVLRLVGDRVNSLPVRRRSTLGREGGMWAGIARGAVAKPIVSAVGAVVVLLALAVPALSLRQGFSGVESLPADNQLRVTVERVADEFGYGENTTHVVLTGDAVGAAAGVAEALEADPAFTDVVVEAGDPAVFAEGAASVGGAVFVVAKDVYEVSDVRAAQALERVRTELVPAAVGHAGIGRAFVGGAVAESEDFAKVMNDWFPWVVGGVLLVSFLILMFVFRSLAVPAMTLFVNVLSVAAAYGVLVGTFQFGWGESLGFTQVDVIAPWVPLFLFAVLFGLSMDYHVFLLSRVREAFGVSGDARSSIVTGVRTTGALITGAALIMVAVFAGFASGDVSELSQMGLGLAVAIILDATLVRVVLVPALLALLGSRAWGVPGWLEWLPGVPSEGGAGAGGGVPDGRELTGAARELAGASASASGSERS